MPALFLLVAGCAGTTAPLPPGDHEVPAPPTTTSTPPAPVSVTTPEPTTAPSGPLPICINELMADNEHGWLDETGADPDWIELHNPGAADVALDGWKLQDHPLDGLVVPGRGYLVLAADGLPDLGPGHLAFSLSAGGEEIALWAPDGRGSIVTYGAMSADRALTRETDCCDAAAGCWIPTMRPTPGASNAGSLLPDVLLARDATWRYREVAEPGWLTPAFDDSAWATGAAPLGFGEVVATTLPATLPSAYFRATFSVADPAALSAVRMRLRYDDGVVVYLNGTRIFAKNAPEIQDGLAVALREEPAEARWHEAEVWRDALVAGDNVLAAGVFQGALESDDLRFELELRSAP